MDVNGYIKLRKAHKVTLKDIRQILVAKGFTQKERIHHKEIFSPVSTKDSFSIIIALVVLFDLELQQMIVKTTFLGGVLEDEIYMK